MIVRAFLLAISVILHFQPAAGQDKEAGTPPESHGEWATKVFRFLDAHIA